MGDKLPRVLVISSADPTVGPGVVGLTHYNALKKAGLDVDFMTKFPVEGHPEFISVYDGESSKCLSKGLWKICRRLANQRIKKQVPGYYFFYKKETFPPVPTRDVLAKIKKQYDVIYVVFWQGLLSFATIEALYDKLKCQFQFRCVDYSPMSGGCHFTGDCQRYQTGCGCCPAVYSMDENDFTHWNVKYRKKIYEKVKPVVYGNSYMNSFYRRSFLLKDYDRLEVVYPVMDNETYRPLDVDCCREKYEIPHKKRFLIFFGCQRLTDERKGMRYLQEALRILYGKLSEEERGQILLIIAGHDIDPIKESLLFDYKYLGFVKPQDLPSVYSMSSVFLSPSVNDAGPSMVNQSLSCGTPVVAFEMGTALDVVKGKDTGYCAKLRDSEDFAKGIESVYKLTSPKYDALRARCRDVAVEMTSKEAFVKKVLQMYSKYS